MTTKTPLKPKEIEKKVRADVSVDVTPEGKIVYSMVEKESNSGLFNNERFLVLNCRDGVLCYHDYIPNTPIPIERISDVPACKPKNSVAFKDIKYERPKEGTKNRLKVTLPNDEKGKPREWLFIMNNKLVDKWIEELDHFKNYPMDKEPATKSPNKPAE